MNIIEKHGARQYDSPPPPAFILKLRLEWFRLACGFMQALEASPTPEEARRYLEEVDAIIRAFERLRPQVRRLTFSAVRPHTPPEAA